MRTITKRRAIGFGLLLASTGLLITACTKSGSPPTPTEASRSQTAAATPVVPVGSHGDHGTADGWADELARVKKATARFHRVEAAADAGYELGYVNGSGVRIITGCVAHPTAGAMGYHYFNRALMDDLSVDPLKPEALVYAPGPNGKLRLAAVECVVRGDETIGQEAVCINLVRWSHAAEERRTRRGATWRGRRCRDVCVGGRRRGSRVSGVRS